MEDRDLLKRLDEWQEGDSAGALIRWSAAHLRGCIASTEEPVDGEERITACVVCGDETLCEYTADPYKQDVENTTEMGWWCDKCYQLACEEI